MHTKKQMNKEQASITLQQLGGSRFLAMTGCQPTNYGPAGLTIKVPARKTNRLRIQLEDNDTYTMEFSKFNRKTADAKVIALHTGVYYDMLQYIFTSVTGLDTYLKIG